MSVLDEGLLDDAAALERADAGGQLRALAEAGARVRSAGRAAEEAGVARVAEDGRPRALLVAATQPVPSLVAAVTGVACPVRVGALRGPLLPGFVGSIDLVAAVSGSGREEDTLALAEEAARRGARLLTVGPAASPLAQLCAQARGVHVPVESGPGPERAGLWALAVPVLLAADALGLAAVPAPVLAATADALDRTAELARPSAAAFANPAKALAAELAGTLPLVWGTGDAGAGAATCFATRLQLDAGVPALHGALPDVAHSQAGVLDGAMGAADGPGADEDDLFRDRGEDHPGTRLRVVLLRDSAEPPRVAAYAGAVGDVAAGRGVGVSQLRAQGTSALERVASLTGLTDFASAYLALATGVDPAPVLSVDELRERTAG